LKLLIVDKGARLWGEWDSERDKEVVDDVVCVLALIQYLLTEAGSPDKSKEGRESDVCME